MGAPTVSYVVTEAVATLTLRRPEARNALDGHTRELLLAAVRLAAGDPGVRAVVLTGEGAAFCAGHDLHEHAALLRERDARELAMTVSEHYAPLALTLATMPKPVVAAVNGVAAGAGASLAFACDLRVAADTAGFALAFTGVGLAADTGASWTLPRLVGRARALELLLLPSTIPATRALDLGLVTEVVPAADLPDRAQALAQRLAAGPTTAYGAIKSALAFSAAHALEESLQFEAQTMLLTGQTDDHRSAVAAFVAKQRPVFTGH